MMTRDLPIIHGDAATKRQSSPYSGHETLLVMQHARKYNQFLANLVRRHGEGLGTVVDFGAGIGAFAQTVKNWAPHLICVEPDQTQAAMLRSSGFLVAADVFELSDNSIGFFYSLNVFEHIQDDERVMADILRKLRNGGRLLVYVPALSWLYSSMDRQVGHCRRYGLGELTEKLRRAGYRIRKAEYVDSLGVLATLAYKLWGDDSGAISIAGLKAYDRFLFPLSRLFDVALRRLLGKNVLVIAEKAA